MLLRKKVKNFPSSSLSRVCSMNSIYIPVRIERRVILSRLVHFYGHTQGLPLFSPSQVTGYWHPHRRSEREKIFSSQKVFLQGWNLLLSASCLACGNPPVFLLPRQQTAWSPILAFCPNLAFFVVPSRLYFFVSFFLQQRFTLRQLRSGVRADESAI